MVLQAAKRQLTKLLEEAGVCALGIAEAEPVEQSEVDLYLEWLREGRHAGMTYLERHLEIRKDPRLLLDGARTVVSVAFNYRQFNPFAGVATYALGLDYHAVIKSRLQRVVDAMKEEFGGDYRICVDSAPIMERYWARKCGLGYRSPRHGNIVVPGVGSMVFLAEILTTLPLPVEKEGDGATASIKEAIGDVDRNFPKVCPVGALMQGGQIDSRKCLNYLTIEHKGDYTEEQRRLLEKGGYPIFGCDCCLRAAAENRGEIAAEPIEELKTHPALEAFIKYVKAVRNGEAGVERPSFPLSRSAMARAKKLLFRYFGPGD